MALPCNNLNLNLYRVFYTVAKTKSFSESSRTLHISQPAISKHIRSLEYELDTLLFYRTNRGIELTPEAKLLFIYVEKAYNCLMLGERELQESKELKKSVITICVPTYISIYYLNNFIKKFMELHKNVVIRVLTSEDNDGVTLLEQNMVDILISSFEARLSDENIRLEDFKKEEYCFAYNKEILGDKKIELLDDLFKEELLIPAKGTKQRKALEEFASSKGFIVTPKLELDKVEMMVSYTENGLGIGYLPLEVALQCDKLSIIDLENELPKSNIYLVYKENILSNFTKDFINTLSHKE